MSRGYVALTQRESRLLDQLARELPPTARYALASELSSTTDTSDLVEAFLGRLVSADEISEGDERLVYGLRWRARKIADVDEGDVVWMPGHEGEPETAVMGRWEPTMSLVCADDTTLEAGLIEYPFGCEPTPSAELARKLSSWDRFDEGREISEVEDEPGDTLVWVVKR